MRRTAPHTSEKSRRRWLTTLFHVTVVLVVAAGFVALRWVGTLPDRVDAQRTILLGSSRLTPDSDASLRVVVQEAGDGKPISNARVKIGLASSEGSGRVTPLFEGRTDETGTLPVSFHVPADAPSEAALVVETRSNAGRDRLESPVTIEREYRVLLTTDKPLYQPAQTIHMRALALSTFDLTAASGATVDFLVEDAKGNKVFRKSVETSDFGVAAADFALADLVNQGDYVLSASVGDASSEKTVEVRPYALPKFGVNVTTDRTFYLPGQRVDGVVQADYFFGKPVAEGEVRVVGSVWDVERTVVVDVQGETDGDGGYGFSFELPEYFAGSALEAGQSQFALEVTVIDQTDHPEQVSRVLPVAAQPLVIEAVPESGVLKPGVENVVYVLVSYPDGRPAQTVLRVQSGVGQILETETGEFGLAEIRFVPEGGDHHVLTIEAEEATGLFARREMALGVEENSDTVLLRADRAAYVVGETMELVVLTPARGGGAAGAGSIYLDLVKGGQTLSTRVASVQPGETDGGLARFAVDVSPDMVGEVEIHAYRVRVDGSVVRDTRLVAVDAPRDLDVAVSADRETYLPGENATVGFDVRDGGGAGVAAALGVAVVDESVFALQRQDPGFAKLYFLLRQELMEPFVQIQGFELPVPELGAPEDAARDAQDSAAKATWAGMSGGTAFRQVDSRQEKMDAAYEAQDEGFQTLARVSSAGMIGSAVALFGVGLAAMIGSGGVKRTLARLALFDAALVGLVLVLAVVWTLSAVDVDVEELLIPLAVLLYGGLLALTVAAFAKRDTSAKSLVLLSLAWGGSLFLVIRSMERAGTGEGPLTIVGLLAGLLIPAAYLILGLVRWWEQRRVVGGLAMGLGALMTIPVLLALPALMSFGGAGLMGAPRSAQLAGLGDDGGMWAVDGAVMVEETVAEVEAEAKGAPVPAEDQAQNGEVGREAPRLRQWFPETLYWAPDVQTDEDGRATLEIPMADSITTWRLTALASSQDGRLGLVNHGLRVFQDFFVDVDLPISLTEGDEISIPVGVFNYLPEEQQVRLEVEREDWFELLGSGEETLTIGSNDIEVVYFPIRVTDFGRQGFQVTAWGEKQSDAVRREVDVVPNGKEIRLTESDWLRGDCGVGIEVPDYAVPGTTRVEVKIYPGVLAQVVEGLEKILRLPHG